jgi:hypothetical protein
VRRLLFELACPGLKGLLVRPCMTCVRAENWVNYDETVLGRHNQPTYYSVLLQSHLNAALSMDRVETAHADRSTGTMLCGKSETHLSRSIGLTKTTQYCCADPVRLVR